MQHIRKDANIFISVFGSKLFHETLFFDGSNTRKSSLKLLGSSFHIFFFAFSFYLCSAVGSREINSASFQMKTTRTRTTYHGFIISTHIVYRWKTICSGRSHIEPVHLQFGSGSSSCHGFLPLTVKSSMSHQHDCHWFIMGPPMEAC